MREPTGAHGQFKAKTKTTEFAEIPNMSEPMIVGCPQWDELGVYSTKRQVALTQLGIVIPTIGAVEARGATEQCLRLRSEVLLEGNTDVYELMCEFNISNPLARSGLSGLSAPWVRAGPNCPSSLQIIEGPIRPFKLLTEKGTAQVSVFA